MRFALRRLVAASAGLRAFTAALLCASVGLREAESAADPVQIAEFMAANTSTLRDQDGDYSDWIELHNEGAHANLDGWYLTNNPERLNLWRFPRVTLLQFDRMLVFASGKDRANPTNELHANFRMAREGGFLALVKPDGVTIASGFGARYPRQHPNISFGRVRYIPEAAGFFTSPSPGAENMTEGPGFAPAVNFSRAGGLATEDFLLELSAPVAGATIRYTTNNLAPTAAAELYTGPIAVSRRVQIRARAFMPGLLPGPIRSEVYVRAAAPLLQFQSHLPVILIDSFGRAIPDNGDLPGYVALFEPRDGVTRLSDPPTLQTRVALDRRGSSTLGQPKGNYNVEAWDEFNDDKPISWLGLPQESDFILHAPFNYDPALLRNPLVYELSAQLGRYAPRYRFVEVFVNSSATATFNTNHYVGLYNLLEKIKPDPNRVDIDRLGLLDNQFPTVSGGYLFKVDRLNPGDSGFGSGGVQYAHVDPQEFRIKTPQSLPQRNWLVGHLNAFNRVLTSASFAHPELGYRPWIDAGAWIDYHLLNTLSGNVDAFRLSTFLYIPRNGPITFGPCWDYDRSLGSTDGRDSIPRSWNTGGSEFFNFPWWSRVFRDPEFWQDWVDRWQQTRMATLSTPHVYRVIDALNAQIGVAADRDFARWRQPKRGRSQEGEITHLKNWLSNRLDFIDREFVRPPEVQISPLGLSLSTTQNATIYYTLDGRDPRRPGGAPARHAAAARTLISLHDVAVVSARAYMSNSPQRSVGGGPPLRNHWSAPVRIRTSPHRPPEPGDLVVNEIHFHPPPTTAAELAALPSVTAEDFEFIELRNVAGRSVDLYGVRFAQGIRFTFADAAAPALAAGGLAVLARNPAAFRLRYGQVPQLAGHYQGRLANQGERLRLVDAAGRTLIFLEYMDQWHPAADGGGASLSLIGAGRDPSAQHAPVPWRAGATWGGTPGYLEPEPWRAESLADWRARHFARAPASAQPAQAADHADPDLDGASNLDEFHAGTDPNDGADFLRFFHVQASAEGTVLRIAAAQGRSYEVQSRELWEDQWRIMTAPFQAESSGLVDVLDPARPGSSGRWYRLAVRPRAF